MRSSNGYQSMSISFWIGSGEGRPAALIKTVDPSAQLVALDFSPLMLQRLRERFAHDPGATILEHSLDDLLPDSVRSMPWCRASRIHHVSHDRKRAPYGKIRMLLSPGGVSST